MPSVTLLKPTAKALLDAQIADLYAQLAAFPVFNPDLYSTTAAIGDMLASYTPKTRTIVGTGAVKINGTASATLAATITVSIEYATNAETIAGSISNKPTHPAGVSAAIAAAIEGFSLQGLKAVHVYNASGTHTPASGATKALVLVVGGGGSGGVGSSAPTYAGGRGGNGGMALGYVNLSGSVSFTIGAGGGAVSGFGNSGNAGGASQFGSIIGYGGGAGGGSNGSATGIAGASAVGAGNILSFGPDGKWQFTSPDYGAGGAGAAVGVGTSSPGIAGMIAVLEF